MTVQTKPVAILGATGTVGQKMISMIERHPEFHVAEVAASSQNAGKLYSEAAYWRDEDKLNPTVAKLTVKALDEVESPYVISALPADVAREIEPLLAGRGQHIFSNASALRMESNIPLLIPEINLSHLELVDSQSTKGKIVTNPNCSTVFMTLGLAPLRRLGDIEHVSVVTLQALSGAGYPGVPSFDMIGNLIPNIGGEEEKIVEESKKILGQPQKPADFDVTVHVHRVPVLHGHTVAMHVRFKNSVSIEDAASCYLEANKENPGLYELYEDQFRPQPARDLHHLDQRAHIGRLKQGGDAKMIGLVCLGHNLVRGAAGAALLNMERGIPYIERK